MNPNEHPAATFWARYMSLCTTWASCFAADWRQTWGMYSGKNRDE